MHLPAAHAQPLGPIARVAVGLAKRLGVSVGKMNYCLRAVIDRGWVKVNNFRRSDNKLGYVYILTPTGVHAKMRMARRFLALKEAEFEQLQREIDALRVEVSRQGVNSVSGAPTSGEAGGRDERP